jgi:flagellar biosynthesis/type III secretory pathway protein FliH
MQQPIKNNKQQTAVEWLYERFLFAGYASPAEWKEKAKEMEKEQIIDAHTEGYVIGGGNGDLYNCKQYYNETYESKGSDAKDVVLGYKTSLDAQMLDKIKLKQETLEESAEKYANELPEPYNYGINSDKKKGFIEGAKWRQEQILQFLYSEIIERRPYSSSKMCEVVIEFIEQLNTKK